MNIWSDGYFSSALPYIATYSAAMNPAQVRLALISAGLNPPDITSALELGFGQGVSVNAHAAASSVEWWGTDFNPEHAVVATSMAQASGSNVRLFDQSFEEFGNRTDLPQFDFIALHGVWSWVSDANRDAIVNLAADRLAPGGVLYLSYNTLPGWASLAPLQFLLSNRADALLQSGVPPKEAVHQVLGFAESLLATEPRYASEAATVGRYLQELTTKSESYIAHELFHSHWKPMHFSEIADRLSVAKLSFAGSANLLESLRHIYLTQPQQEYLAEIVDPTLREDLSDFMTNQRFRADYWVKGAAKLSLLEQAEMLRETSWLLTADPNQLSLQHPTPAGTAELDEAVYSPIVGLLGEKRALTIEEIESAMALDDACEQSPSLPQIVQALIFLLGRGDVALISSTIEEAEQTGVKQQVDGLNDFLASRARTSGDLPGLVSPVTGGAIRASRWDQLFSAFMQNGQDDPQELAESVYGIMSAQGQTLVKEGAPLESPEDNIAELADRAEEFVGEKAAVLRALGIL